MQQQDLERGSTCSGLEWKQMEGKANHFSQETNDTCDISSKYARRTVRVQMGHDHKPDVKLY